MEANNSSSEHEMNTEPEPITVETPALPPLPVGETIILTRTQSVPHIIHAGKNGFVAAREGKLVPAKMKVELWFTEDKQEEPVFQIKAQNGFNICGHNVSVLNDEGEYSGIHLFASVPSASEYMALVGKPVVINFISEPINTRAAPFVNLQRERLYRNVRTTILELP